MPMTSQDLYDQIFAEAHYLKCHHYPFDEIREAMAEMGAAKLPKPLLDQLGFAFKEWKRYWEEEGKRHSGELGKPTAEQIAEIEPVHEIAETIDSEPLQTAEAVVGTPDLSDIPGGYLNGLGKEIQF